MIAFVGGAGLIVALSLNYLAGGAFQSRYSAIVFPFFVLLVARGFTTLRDPRILGGVLGVAIVLGFAGGVRNVVTQRTQAGEVASVLRREAKPGDLVVYCPDQVGPSVHRLTPVRSRRGRVPELRRAGTRRLGRLQEATGRGRSRPRSRAPRSPGPARTRSGTSSAPGYITHAGTCEAISDDFAAARSPAAAHALRQQDLREARAADVPGADQELNAHLLAHRSIGARPVRDLAGRRARRARDDPPHRHDPPLRGSARDPLGSARVGRVVVPRHRALRLRRRRVGRACASSRCSRCSGARSSWLPGVSAGLGVVFVANVSALALGFVLYRLVMQERDDPELARACGVARLSRSARVRARDGLRGSDVHDVRGDRAARAAVAALVARGGLRFPRRADPTGRRAARGAGGGRRLAAPRREGRRARGRARARAARVPRLGRSGARTTSGIRCARSRIRRGAGTGSIPIRAVAHNVHELFVGDHVSAGVHVVSALVFVALLVRARPALAALVHALRRRRARRRAQQPEPRLARALRTRDAALRAGRRRRHRRARAERVVLYLAGAGLVAASILAFTGVLVP